METELLKQILQGIKQMNVRLERVKKRLDVKEAKEELNEKINDVRKNVLKIPKIPPEIVSGGIKINQLT